MLIRIAGIVEESIVDGPGYRFAIFTQGCPHGCAGCHNPETHDFDGGKTVDTQVIIDQFSQNPLLDGITLSGGEPFCQPEACLQLAKAAHKKGLTVWCYTGYVLDQLLQEHDPDRMALLEEIDVLVDGPFIERYKSMELRFRGSKNQRLIDVKKSLREGRIVLWRDDDAAD